MITFKPIPYDDKAAFYAELLRECEATFERIWFTNLSSCAGALMAHLPRVNWTGFYMWHDGELRLGPFQGLPACLRIPLGQGVCGTSASQRQALVVGDVHEFPGHIACDPRSRSEIVIPLLREGRLLGVLDIDSPELNRFDGEDLKGLKTLMTTLIKKTEWPISF